MARKNGTQYESEFRNILKKNGHVVLLGSVVSVDVIDVCCSTLYEVKSSLKITDRPHISLDNPRLVKQFQTMQEYSKKVQCRYVVRYRGKKWYFFDVHANEPVPTSLEFVPEVDTHILAKGRYIKGILKPVEEMDLIEVKK